VKDLKKIKRRLRIRQPFEESIYCADFREKLLENGEISSAEAGFMRGYEEA